MTKTLLDGTRKTDKRGRAHRRKDKREQPNDAQDLMATDHGDPNPIPLFFRLPRELRDKIYRYAHVNARPIGSGCSAWDHETRTTKLRPFSCQLSSAAFRTCRQWHTEARPILYGENTFGIVVRASALRWSVVDQAVDAVQNHFFPLEIITRISIIVKVLSQLEIAWTRSLVAMLSWVLKTRTKLRRLNIDLLVNPFVHGCSRILESLVSVQNVGYVSFDRVSKSCLDAQLWFGVPANYQLYLKSFMEAELGPKPLTLATPVLHQLFIMYRVLNDYAKKFPPIIKYEASLELACEAMVECNVQKFKSARKDIMKLINPRKGSAPPWLFEHDVKDDLEVEELQFRSANSL